MDGLGFKTLNNSLMSFSFRFVCQGGDLEYKAAVLAASLKYHLRCHYELIACVPSDTSLMRPKPATLEFLQKMGCKIRSIENLISRDYLIGHKFDCLRLPTDYSYKVFLDSDILCTQLFTGFFTEGNPPFLAKLEDWNHHSPEEWSILYAYFKLDAPVFSFRSTVLKESMPLYFNAGVLCMQRESAIVDEWLEVAVDMEENLEIPRKRPNLDQLALAITIRKEDHRFQLLSERYNYPAELRSFDPVAMPFFCHYHNPLMILASKHLTDLCRKIGNAYPSLKSLLQDQNNNDWKLIFDVF